MVTTLIKKDNDKQISFNPVDLGHSAFYQEFKCKVYDRNSTNAKMYFMDTKYNSINVTMANIQGTVNVGTYYPYICFNKHGQFEKIILCYNNTKPINYSYYTRVNAVITVGSGIIFTAFDDIILQNNMRFTDDTVIKYAEIPVTSQGQTNFLLSIVTATPQKSFLVVNGELLHYNLHYTIISNTLNFLPTVAKYMLNIGDVMYLYYY